MTLVAPRLMNLGYIEQTRDIRENDEDNPCIIVARVYYSQALLAEHPTAEQDFASLAPLIDGTFVNGGRGWCLDVVNKTPKYWNITIGAKLDEIVAPGATLTMKASTLAALGIRTRGDASDLNLCNISKDELIERGVLIVHRG